MEMRKQSYFMFVLLIAITPLFSCGKKKPTAPQPTAYVVILQYQNYLGPINCFRLMVGTNPINQCGLGYNSMPVTAGDYDCKLYAVTNNGSGEFLTLIATSPLHLDRNFKCVIDGADIYWLYLNTDD
jgi:hypothetical protein